MTGRKIRLEDEKTKILVFVPLLHLSLVTTNNIIYRGMQDHLFDTVFLFRLKLTCHIIHWHSNLQKSIYFTNAVDDNILTKESINTTLDMLLLFSDLQCDVSMSILIETNIQRINVSSSISFHCNSLTFLIRSEFETANRLC